MSGDSLGRRLRDRVDRLRSGSEADGTESSDPDESGPRSPAVSRRSLLAGVMTVGGSGVLVDARATSSLSDTELFGGDRPGAVLAAGELGLRLAWEETYRSRNGSVETEHSPGSDWAADCAVAGFTDDPPPSFALADDIQPGDSGTVRIAFRPSGGSGRLWGGLATACPTGPLATAVRATVTFGRCDGGEGLVAAPLVVDGEPRDRLSGPLCEVLSTLSDGVGFSDGCLDPGGTYRLDIDWRFGPIPERVARYEGATIEFGLGFRYLQCRHASRSASTFGDRNCDCPLRYGISNVELYALEEGECRYAGKLELEDGYCGRSEGLDDSYLAPGRYDLYQDGTGCEATPYVLDVTDTSEKQEERRTETTGLALALRRRDGVEPQLCRVDVFAGGRQLTYASAADFDGNTTDGLLYAPVRTTGPPAGRPGTDGGKP